MTTSSHYLGKASKGSLSSKIFVHSLLEHSRSLTELYQKQPPPSLNPTTTRSGSYPIKSIHPPSVWQPHAAGAPLYRASSLPLSSSHSRQELLPPSLLPPSLWQPRAAGSPRMKRLFLNQSSISAQWEISQKEPPRSLYLLAAHPRARALPERASPSLYLAATRSSSSPRKQPPSYLYLAAPRKRKPPD